MIDQKTIFAIDAGNTSVKIGVFKNGTLDEIVRVQDSDIQTITGLVQENLNSVCIVSSVLKPDFLELLKKNVSDLFIVDHQTSLPFDLDYKTPQTLGIDRICNAAAMFALKKSEKAVSIDIGTCIKFDLLSQNKYVGGSISPGIQLRYNALNDYTANLPRLNTKDSIDLVGKSTYESIHSGVINGIETEITGTILRYIHQFGSDLTFFVTGGDAEHFDFDGKNNIFVDKNLTLKGLYQIYLHNAH